MDGKRENNKHSGREDGPDGNAAVHGDVDSRPSKGEPAGGGQDFIPLGLHSLTGSRHEAERPADRQTEHRCMRGSRAKAKGTAASYLCSAASQRPCFTMYHHVSDNPMISTVKVAYLEQFLQCY